MPAEVVGSLYEPGDRRREQGYTVVYWGICLGAVLGPIVCSAIGRHFGMRYGFSAAGVGMLIALVTFVYGQRYFPVERDPHRFNHLREKVAPWLTLENLIYLVALVSVVVFWQLLRMYEFVSGILVWFGLCLGLFITYFAFRRCERQERDQMLVIGTIVFFSVIYSVVNYQLFGSLILFLDRYVDRVVAGNEIPAPMFISTSSVIALLLAPLVAYFWVRLRRIGSDPNPAFKIGLGLIAPGLSYMVPLLAVAVVGSTESMSLGWIVLLAIVLVVGEICLVPVAQSVISTIAPRRNRRHDVGLFRVCDRPGRKPGRGGSRATDRRRSGRERDDRRLRGGDERVRICVQLSRHPRYGGGLRCADDQMLLAHAVESSVTTCWTASHATRS